MHGSLPLAIIPGQGAGEFRTPFRSYGFPGKPLPGGGRHSGAQRLQLNRIPEIGDQAPAAWAADCLGYTARIDAISESP
jgi:hypothetical protein